MKRALVLILRILLLTVVYSFLFSLVFALVVPAQQYVASPQETTVLLLTLSFLNTLVIAYVVSRASWSGWKLILALSFVIFGVTTLMPQIETLVFVNIFRGLLLRLFIAGFLFSLLFSPLAVLILGKRRSDGTSNQELDSLSLSVNQWIIRLSLIAVVYVILYFTFGYFVAWQSPAVRDYYGGTDAGNFFAQMYSTFRETPWLLPFQLFRGLLWAAIAVPVIRMTKGDWWRAGLSVALLFCVVMNTQLLLPNPLMPTDVRMAHLVETATSNFIFGWLLVWILRRRERHVTRNQVEATS